MIEIARQPDDSPKEKNPQKELERTAHLIFRRTRALIAYAKGECHGRRDLIECVEQIEAEESGFVNSMSDMSRDPEDTIALIKEEILGAPYLELIIELEEKITKLPNASRERRISLKQLLDMAQELESAA
ncbi:hypothetical protein KKF55_05980 [Patescibacteria group bacterium]|nr:hypothetical protein [Patescibacteria group bacterium]